MCDPWLILKAVDTHTCLRARESGESPEHVRGSMKSKAEIYRNLGNRLKLVPFSSCEYGAWLPDAKASVVKTSHWNSCNGEERRRSFCVDTLEF